MAFEGYTCRANFTVFFLYPYISLAVHQTMPFNNHKNSEDPDLFEYGNKMVNDNDDFDTYKSIRSQEQLVFNSLDELSKFIEMLGFSCIMA